MAAIGQDLVIAIGETFSRRLLWTNNGVLVNLTNFTAVLEVRERAGSTAVLVRFSTGTTDPGRITLGGAAGTIDLLLPAPATAVLPTTLSAPAVYSLVLTAPDGTVSGPLDGQVLIAPFGTPVSGDTITITTGGTGTGGTGGAVASVNGRAGLVTGLAEQTALTAEQTARTSADTALSGRIGTVETALPGKVDTSGLAELVQDLVGAMLVAGTGVGLVYDDALGTLTLTVTGGAGGTTDPEVVRDTIAAALRATGAVQVAVDDVLDTITITTTATVNAPDAALRDRTTHTGVQSLDTTTDSATRLALTAAERSKLAGVTTGATANSADAALRDRTTHTGVQPSSTISDFTEAAQDAVAALLVAGAGVGLVYDDVLNTLTLTASGGGGGVTDPEVVRDTIAAALRAGSLITVTVDDLADTITIGTTATANSTDAALRDRTTHTGTQSLDSTTDSATRLALTAAERSKLAGVATGATANSTDAQLRDRTSHTGTQPSTTISDFAEAAQDAVAALLVAGTGVTLVYDDVLNTLTLTAAGGGATDPEVVRDTIGLALRAGSLVTVTVDDVADTITIGTTATANSTDASLRDRTTHTGTQSLDTTSDSATRLAFLPAERTKLTGVATGATAEVDATTLVKGRVQLAGDLGGTAALPTVPALAGKASTTDPRFTDNRVPTDGSVTDAKVAAGAAIGLDKTADSATRLAFLAAERSKLTGIAAGATANSTDAQLRDRTTHTGTQSLDTTTDSATRLALTAAERTKLAGIDALLYRTVTVATTAAPGDFLAVDATAGPITITLPTAPPAGARVGVKKIDATGNAVTVDPPGALTIDGDATAVIIARWAGGTFLYDGANWLLYAPTYAGQSDGVIDGGTPTGSTATTTDGGTP